MYYFCIFYHFFKGIVLDCSIKAVRFSILFTFRTGQSCSKAKITIKARGKSQGWNQMYAIKDLERTKAVTKGEKKNQQDFNYPRVGTPDSRIWTWRANTKAQSQQVKACEAMSIRERYFYSPPIPDLFPSIADLINICVPSHFAF